MKKNVQVKHVIVRLVVEVVTSFLPLLNVCLPYLSTLCIFSGLLIGFRTLILYLISPGSSSPEFSSS